MTASYVTIFFVVRDTINDSRMFKNIEKLIYVGEINICRYAIPSHKAVSFVFILVCINPYTMFTHTYLLLTLGTLGEVGGGDF